MAEKWDKIGFRGRQRDGGRMEMKRRWNVRKKKDADSNEVVEATEGSEETGKGVVQKRV